MIKEKITKKEEKMATISNIENQKELEDSLKSFKKKILNNQVWIKPEYKNYSHFLRIDGTGRNEWEEHKRQVKENSEMIIRIMAKMGVEVLHIGRAFFNADKLKFITINFNNTLHKLFFDGY